MAPAAWLRQGGRAGRRGWVVGRCVGALTNLSLAKALHSALGPKCSKLGQLEPGALESQVCSLTSSCSRCGRLAPHLGLMLWPDH